MIHPTAIVSKDVQLGANVSIGPFSIIHSGVRIGAGSKIGSHCELGLPTADTEGKPLTISEGALIRSHSVFYAGSEFGPNLVTGHRVTVREFVSAGRNFQLGTLSDVQGRCRIANYVRTHSNVHIGQHSEIEDFVWIFPYVVLTNDPHPPSNSLVGVKLKKFSVIATMSVILPGVSVGEGALVGAGSVVNKSVLAHTVVVGNPARERGETSSIKMRDGSGRSAYPWSRHFRRGYPADAMAELDAFSNSLNDGT